MTAGIGTGIVRAFRSLARVVLTLTGVLLIVFALLTLAARLLLPLASGYKGDLEARIGEYLERPVMIGKLDLAWRSNGPELRLADVSVVESDRRSVRFRELLVDVDLLRSAIHRTLVVDELTLVGADLAIDYSGDGRFVLHGVEQDATPGPTDAESLVDPDVDDDAAGLDVVGWLLDADKVGLLDTRLTIDDASSGRSLVIDSINVRAESVDTLHRLRVEFELPSALGKSIEAGIDLVGSSENLADAAGDFYIKGTDMHLHGWRNLRAGMLRRMVEVPNDAVRTALAGALDAARADADVELWGSWQDAEIVTGRARLDVNDLVIGMPTEAEAEVDPASPDRILLDRLQADLSYRDNQPGWTVQADRIELNAGEDHAVIENVEFGRGDRPAPNWRVSASGDRLPLALFGRATTALSVLLNDLAVSGEHTSAAEAVDVASDARLQAIASFAPVGDLVDWTLDMRALENNPLVSFDADLDKIGMGSIGLAPGIQGIDGIVRLKDGRGTVTLDGSDAALIREDARLDIDAFDLALTVDARIPGQTRADGRMSIARESLELGARFGITSGAERSPRIDLQGRYTIGDVSDVVDWLPYFAAPDRVEAWFDRALRKGRADNGMITWFGRLADFPYENGNGTLQSSFELSDGKLAFLPGWPEADLPTGRVELNGLSLTARSSDARLTSFRTRRLEVRIDDLRFPVVSFEASGSDKLSAILEFGREGPLAWLLGSTLADVKGTGQAGMDLALDVPLSRAARRQSGDGAGATGRRAAGAGLTLDGAVFLDGNEVSFGRANLTLAKSRGAISYSESGIRIGSMKATLFDRPISIEGESRGSPGAAETVITATGVLAPGDVLANYDLPLERFVSGASRWKVTLVAPHSRERFASEGLQLSASSNLLGVGVLLPAPLAKSSAVESEFRLSTAFRAGSARTHWRIVQDDRVNVLVEIDATGMRALSARLGGGTAAKPPPIGIAIDGHADAIAFDGWATAIANLLSDLPPAEGEATPILPLFANVTADALVAGSQSLGAATLKTTTDDNYINVVLDNQRVNGSLRYPRTHWRRELPALLRIGHVDKSLIDALGSGPETGEPVAALDPRELPAIDAHISSLRWDSLSLTDVNVTIGAVENGVSFVTQALSRGDTTLDARGFWLVRDDPGIDASRPGNHRSEIALSLAGQDLGAGLAAVGYPGVLDDGSGEATATLEWRAPIYQPSLPLLSGDAHFELERGTIVPLDPGAARLVGLFALQAIPRRLSLDFTDVTSDGLAFEKVIGSVSLDGGIADVELVQLTGPVGVVDVTGTSNLITRQYDQRISVLPRISAALPIIGLVSAGATGGIGALVAGGVLKAIGLDVDRIGLRRFALTGSWDEPEFGTLSASRRTGRD